MKIFDLLNRGLDSNITSRCGYDVAIYELEQTRRFIHGCVFCETFKYHLTWDENGECVDKPKKPFLHYYDLVNR